MKSLNLILAITTYNRLFYLKRCIETWNKTKSSYFNWTIIVADNGSTDGTLEMLKQYDVIVLNTKQKGVHFQTNNIIKFLSNIKFDVCFKVDDDVFFIEEKWDIAYLNGILNSGYEHLVFAYDKRPKLDSPIYKKKLKCINPITKVLGCFFTITPNIIRRVGYFDWYGFGPQESGHIDYTRRCGVLGFNDKDFPFDIIDSNKYISLSWFINDNNYFPSLPEELRDKRRTIVDPIKFENNFFNYSDSRSYIKYRPYIKL